MSNVLLRSPLERQKAHEIAAALKPFDRATQERLISGMWDSIKRRKAESSKELRKLEAEMANLDRDKTAINEMIEIESTMNLQKAEGSVFHKLVDAIATNKAFYPLMDKFKDERLACSASGIFVIEHDWAGAFTKAQEFSEGEFRLPYDVTCFELKISGHRICAIFKEGPEFLTYVQTSVGWAMAAPCRLNEGRWEGVYGDREPRHSFVLAAIGAQARAVSIALDAEVAISEIVRAPHKLNAAREKRGALPLRDYHVISLARRSRAAPLASGAGSEGTRKRLHFRRGHWRHYEDHKTWIRWTLVGNPDLGFIDKHYRL